MVDADVVGELEAKVSYAIYHVQDKHTDRNVFCNAQVSTKKLLTDYSITHS